MAFGRIGVAVVDQALDHGDDLRDMRGGFRLDVRRRHAQARHVGAVRGGVLVGDGADSDAQLAGRGVDLVIHVGDVACVAQLAVTAAQQRGQYAEHHRPTGIADVHVVVDRRSADVHGGAGRVQRREGLGLSRQVVVQSQGHGVGYMRKPGDSTGRCMPLTASIQPHSSRVAYTGRHDPAQVASCVCPAAH